MKASHLFFIMSIILATVSCIKNEVIEPASSIDPSLKAAACTPSVINYNVRDTLEVPVYFFPACIPEPIMVTLYDMTSKGHYNVAGSCRFNDKGNFQIHITGYGMYTNHAYDSYAYIEHHAVGSMTGQGAQINRVFNEITITDITTGATYPIRQTIHQVINANGEIIVNEVEFTECE